MTLVLETGAGLPNSNAYADLSEGDAYHEMHLYADDWNGADAPRKETALMMMTRVIDVTMEFYGWKSTSAQALEWPRLGVPNENELYWPITGLLSGSFTEGIYFPSNVVPVRLKQATIEGARTLLKSDRTADYDALGVSSFGLGQGALTTTFSSSKTDRPQVFTDQVKAALQPLGQIRLGRTMLNVYRG
jgi:hypothetical protein